MVLCGTKHLRNWIANLCRVTCQCGLPRSDHNTEALNYLSATLNEKWAAATHTQTKPTNAFGEIEFSTQKTSKVSNIRLSSEEHSLLKLIFLSLNVNCLKVTLVLISVR